MEVALMTRSGKPEKASLLMMALKIP